MSKFFVFCAIIIFLYFLAEGLVLFKCQNPLQDEDFQYIILLGANGRTDSPLVIDRSKIAIEAMRKWPKARLLISGNADRGEIEAYKAVLTLENALPANTLYEDQSKTTWENFNYSKKLIEKEAKVLIITNEFHQPRALAIARVLGLRASIYGKDPRDYQLAFQYWVRERLANFKFLIQFFASFFVA